MKITPGFDKMLVRIVKVESKTAAGVFLPGTETVTDEKMLLAQVVSVGPPSQLPNGQRMIQLYGEGDYIVMPVATPRFNTAESPLAFIRGAKELDTAFVRIGDVTAKVELEEGELIP